jgi:hypothetical protein
MKGKEGAAESLPSKAQVHRGSEENYGASQIIYMPHPGMARDTVAFLKTPKWKRPEKMTAAAQARVAAPV